ncbi:hypothetical protein ScPMuIL_016063 [Solemya velum]
MADTSNAWHVDDKSNASAVVDLQDVEEMEIIDKHDTAYYGHEEPKSSEKRGFFDDVKQRMAQSITEKMWQTGSSEAKKAWNIYGNIDILRPYFNVEPHEVQSRLLWSLIPQKPTTDPLRVPRELYGPMMVIFTLIALLLFQMKHAEHTVEEGTLMGTSFGVCFMYWFGASGFVWFMTYVCNTQINMVQILNMLGYGLFGHCLVLFIGTLLHTSHDHLLFYLLWAVIGGLSSLRMACILISRTPAQTQRLVICGVVATLHLLFLLYLHFAYHKIVEEISEVFDEHRVVPQPDVPFLRAESNQEQPRDTIKEVVQSVTQAVVDKAKQLVNLPNMENVQNTINKTMENAIRQAIPLDLRPNSGLVADVQSNPGLPNPAPLKTNLTAQI